MGMQLTSDNPYECHCDPRLTWKVHKNDSDEILTDEDDLPIKNQLWEATA